MNDQQQAAMQMAYVFIESLTGTGLHREVVEEQSDVLTALREALITEKTGLVSVRLKAQPKPPKWYTRDEIVSVLKNMNYCESICQELADWFVLHLQHSFNKGFQVGQREKNTPPVVPQGEPVGFSVQNQEDFKLNRITPSLVFDTKSEIEEYLAGSDTAKYIVAIYTTPPSVEAAIAEAKAHTEKVWKHIGEKRIKQAIAATKEKAAKIAEKLTPTDADGVCPVAAAIRSMK